MIQLARIYCESKPCRPVNTATKKNQNHPTYDQALTKEIQKSVSYRQSPVVRWVTPRSWIPFSEGLRFVYTIPSATSYFVRKEAKVDLKADEARRRPDPSRDKNEGSKNCKRKTEMENASVDLGSM